MKKNSHLYKKILIALFTLFQVYAHAETFFSGFAGAVSDLDFYKKEEYESGNPDFAPQLIVDMFFSGQFNLSQNIILHTEFSVETSDLFSGSIFKKTDAKFRIDELSIIFRSQFGNITNYFSAFAGSYEPIGSDIFLRRQFGIKPIVSKITNTWQGIKGSVLNSHFGFGGADVILHSDKPLAFGIYAYVNQELDDCYVFNSDLRFACVYRYFTFDVAAGIGVPLINNSKINDSLVSIEKIYWRAGANMLLGNAQTTSLFIQAGISDIPFSKKQTEFRINKETTYLLFEPRFKFKTFQTDITVFNLPQATIDDFIFIKDTLGLNLHVYTDNLYLKNHIFTFGIHTTLSFPEKTFADLIYIQELFDNYSITVSPYTTTKFIKGELNIMLQTRISDIIKLEPVKAFTVNIGFKTQF